MQTCRHADIETDRSAERENSRVAARVKIQRDIETDSGAESHREIGA